ncbi:Rho-binding antiterminator [Reinekea marinisedimentorum]|uniref:Rho-binding antiterminator n=1 Tax=Reinekea marinisedimentorum TaxID=230495 RepID=A0A4R3I6E4_9GAMM|nr:Rho-binding antiterminator [Reinekea marinisedimentorum]TCS41273.1 Rho-binding antiterminator [Reinekea marinisedimentorum]
MISCNNYDYVEIVCMFNYPVRVTLRSGEVLHGIALDTARNGQREECLKLSVDGAEVLVVLDSIAILKAGIENPHFSEVEFS